MLKAMPGITDFLPRMMLMDLLGYLVERNTLLKNLIIFFLKALRGLPFGYLILIIGQEMSIICSQFGCFLSQTGQT